MEVIIGHLYAFDRMSDKIYVGALNRALLEDLSSSEHIPPECSIGPKPMDRRISRTRKALLEALRDLMQEQDWDTIQISSICDRADVARSTFYAHFETKNELLVYGFSLLEGELSSDHPGRGLDLNLTFAFIPALLKHVQGHQRLFARMQDSVSRAGVFARFREVVDTRCGAEIAKSRGWRTLSPHAAVFLQGGVFAIVERWHRNGSRQPMPQMVRRIDALTARILPALRG